jgi:hypothetical protein
VSFHAAPHLKRHRFFFLGLPPSNPFARELTAFFFDRTAPRQAPQNTTI